MSHAKNKVEWCLKKAEKEMEEKGSHRGLLKIKSSVEKAREHIKKAEHNLEATLYFHKGGYVDWCSTSIFYCIYHCFLAILSKFGYETRNQECTFALIASLIGDEKISIEKKDFEKVSSLDISSTQESSRTVVSIREEYQYSTKVSLKDKEYQELLELAKRILDKTKEDVVE
jgi:uncharacterized protein (UPF0332 family)